MGNLRRTDSFKNTSPNHSAGRFLTQCLSQEMHLIRGQGRWRRLTLVVGLALLIFLVSCYQTIEASYLDLVDSLIEEPGPSYDGKDGFVNLDLACADASGWVEEWISSGVMPRCSLAHLSTVEILYTWVNGSETLYRQEKEKYQADSPVFGGTGRVHDRKVSASERRHREHDELRYSIRSIFKYLNGGFSAIRILASDFFDGRNWVGQVPHWLDMEAARKHGVSLLFTSEIYGEKRTELPVFSSLAIESQFYNVPSSGPNHDVMLYFNDDMFLASEHTVSDFWNPIIGVNVQIDPRVWVPNYHATVDEIQRDWNSEWPALRYSNWILSQRFGWRRRSYVAHHAKVLSRRILKEVHHEFEAQFNETSRHRFRAEGKDINTIFLHTHYIMERHREVLLESYLVYRGDMNGDGALDYNERQVIYDQIQSALRQPTPRKTVQEQKNAMVTAQLPLPMISKQVWAAADGYPFALKNPSNPMTEEDIKAPNEPMYSYTDAAHNRKPGFDFVEMCLTKDFIDPGHADTLVEARLFFQLLAREYPYCGDTLLTILIPASKSGLHHLLPPPSHPKYSEIAHNLHKYAYTVSETSSEFIMAKSANELKKGFNRALRTLKHRGLAQFCVNDDVESGGSIAVQAMDAQFRGILQGYFGGLTADKGATPLENPDSIGEINEQGLNFWRAAAFKGGPGYEKNAVLI